MKRYKHLLLLLYLLTLIFGCQSENEAGSALSETAAPTQTAAATADQPGPTTEPSPQPTNTRPAPSATPQPTHTPTPLPTATATSVPVDWSLIQTGTTILYYYDRDLWRANIDGTERQALTEGDLLESWDLESNEDKWWSGGFMPRPFVSPDGRWIAFTQTGGNLVIIDLSDPASPRTLSSGSVLMAWSPDSRYLAYGRGSLHLYDTVTSRASTVASVSSRGPHQITWSPDGRYIGFACCFAEPEGEYEGVEYGYIRQYDLETRFTDTVGETISGVAGGVPRLCWQEDKFVSELDVEDIEVCIRQHNWFAYMSSSVEQNLTALINYSSPEDPLNNRLLTVKDKESDEVLWQMVLDEPANRYAWSVDGHYLILNNYYPGLFPIWRLLADGTAGPEMIIEEGFLLDVIPMWEE